MYRAASELPSDVHLQAVGKCCQQIEGGMVALQHFRVSLEAGAIWQTGHMSRVYWHQQHLMD